MASPQPALAGFTVGVTADRRADEQIELLERRGARVLHGPTIRTRPLSGDPRLQEVTRAIVADPPDVVVITTAIGLRSWHGAAESHGLGDALRRALGRATVLTRGPKAAGAALTLGLDVAWSAPSARSAEVVDHVAATAGPGSTVAVQLDGGTTDHIGEHLAAAGFVVRVVPVYRWAVPDDPAPAGRLVAAIVDRSVDAVTFTAAPAVRNLFAIAGAHGAAGEVRDALGRGEVDAVCIGSACAEAAAAEGITGAIVPDHFRLGAMVQAYVRAVADRARTFMLDGTRVTVQGRLVSIDGHGDVELSTRERDVFAALARRPGAVVPKTALVQQIWGSGERDTHLAEVTVARLRQRLGPAGRGIETVVRRGYRLDATAG
ncbi:MAG: uroporphyrinogen-III synthase [Actinobacteria bacterium]|nr:uroporphyrinogen-III synthase [Actinomycetota bacterium]